MQPIRRNDIIQLNILINLSFVANLLKNFPIKVQKKILKQANINATANAHKEWLIKFSPLSTQVDTIIIETITAFGFKNWKKKVSINLTGFSLELLELVLEKAILYAK